MSTSFTEALIGLWHGRGYSDAEQCHYIGQLEVTLVSERACLQFIERLCPVQQPGSSTVLTGIEHRALSESERRYEDCSIMYFDKNQQMWMVNQYVPEGGVLNKAVTLESFEMRWWGGPEQQLVRFLLKNEHQLCLTVGQPVLIELHYQKVT